MSPLVQTLGSAVLGGAVALVGFVWLTGAGDPPAPAGAEGFAPGMVVLSQGACPAGWAASGQTFILTSPEYPMVEGQKASNPGIMTSSTMGWANVNFNLCVKGAAP